MCIPAVSVSGLLPVDDSNKKMKLPSLSVKITRV